jgi:hypothetical protein
MNWVTKVWSEPAQVKAQVQDCISARWLVVILAALIVAGCKSSSPAPYVSPKVTGRVVDEQTQQPLKGVKVQRLIPDQEPNVANNVKGGQVMMKAPVARTAADGTFELASERSLSPFLRGGWYSVSIAFEHPAYIRYRTNYSLKHAVLTPKGEPVVNAGDIPLARKSSSPFGN